MKNQDLFFEEQLFSDFDLSEYIKRDVRIPNTNVHIYEFECTESEESLGDEEKAKKLDRLSERFNESYTDLFKVVYSESLQYFCERIYPLIVKIETKLRYAIYVSRALFENENVNKDSFQIGQKNKKGIEETDFGEIYEAVFTDNELQGKVKIINGQKLTKADLIKMIESVEEHSLWEQIVGTEYNYIVEHFLEIKNYRNDVMHNHLITYAEYAHERKILKKAINELDRVINDKLLINKSSYSNKTNVMEVIGGLMVVAGAVAAAVSRLANSEKGQGVIKMLGTFGEAAYKSGLLLANYSDDGLGEYAIEESE